MVKECWPHIIILTGLGFGNSKKMDCRGTKAVSTRCPTLKPYRDGDQESPYFLVSLLSKEVGFRSRTDRSQG